MNKADLIEAVQEELGTDCSKAHAERAVNSVLSSIGAGLEKDSTVQLVGFGSFIVRERKLQEEPRTLESLGKELGLSKERVRQLEAAAFSKMRKYLEKNSQEVASFF